MMLTIRSYQESDAACVGQFIRTTGIRNGWSFEGTGLRYQPMKMVLSG